MTDCLFIGHNDGHFPDYVKLVESWGTDTAIRRRLNLAFIEIDGVPHHCMDVVNRYNGRDGRERPKLSNMDFLWPAVSYLASYVARRGFTFDFVCRFQEEKAALADRLSRDDVLAVAVTTTLYVDNWSIEEVIGFVREHNRSARIIVGGPYIRNLAAALPPPALERFFTRLGTDVYVISPEGELALTKVLDALKHGRCLQGIDNIAYREDGGFVRTATSAESNSLSENMIDYGVFPPDRVGDCVSVRTAKSCPFACSFCAYPQQGGPYVYEDVETVEAELDRIRRVGTVRAVTFLDDTFNVPKGRFKDIMRMMIRNGYGFRWNSFLRADHVDAEAVDLMRESGCEGVFLGTESGSDRILKTMNKAARSEHYRRLIPLLKDAGILTHCSLIIGFPGETPETVAETVALIEDAGPDTFRTQLWYCDPETPIWNRREEFGLTGTGFDWAHRTMDAPTATEIVDELFLTVRNSTWLPQHGFETWSLYYLQRRGMPLPQLMAFIRDFNQAVKFKLRHPGGRPLDPRVLDAVSASSRF
jgi:anaerobic magnesium-protoporphyrin IX monomethyl ester cyclase